ncbi:SDR family NAD(P)-dependent oxidoreductase [Shewanella sp. KX20019]|uniref:SDR family NAD(P)-dependent oxidoreductase n=1 Tax=Shewanella sp. KX20019 TaxID=2803864 RepID=UPI0019269D52|nr:SDR family NAD(P)-dependent oxidoreductase [Shewanella sp. KX20019]QQX80711.1 SDR family NAD(P)-dependent oxidoreductase [Shewanella sp. KX20019]
MILITGASSGLGAALAELYSQETTVRISGRNAERLSNIATTLGANVDSHACDLSNEQSVTELFDSLPQTPSVIIHSAGSGYFGRLEDQSVAAINSLITNNITSAIMLLREAVKRYKDKPVTVVMVMSTAAQLAKAEESTYCAAKWAVRGLVESVRLELKNHPMKLVAVYPGGMATPFWDTSGKTLNTSQFMGAEEAALMLKQALTATEHGYISDITINRG